MGARSRHRGARSSTVPWALGAAILAFALAACSSSTSPSPRASATPTAATASPSTPAVQPAREWPLSLQSEAAPPCVGSATVTAPGRWTTVDGALVSSAVGQIDAFCDHSARYRKLHPDLSWTLPAMLALVWPDGQCANEAPATIAGHPGGVCSYAFGGNTFVYATAIVGDCFVSVGGQVAGDSTAAETMAAIVKTVALTVS